MYVYVRKVKNSQARTGHRRGMGGRWTVGQMIDDDTHERHTDTNKLTRHIDFTHSASEFFSHQCGYSPPPAAPTPRACMYVCRKVKNSQARTGHQRGKGLERVGVFLT